MSKPLHIVGAAVTPGASTRSTTLMQMRPPVVFAQHKCARVKMLEGGGLGTCGAFLRQLCQRLRQQLSLRRMQGVNFAQAQPH